MADVLTAQQRKCCMSNVKNKDTDIEIAFRRALWSEGLRFRLNFKVMGKPDIVFISKKIAIFVDGCYWHGCPVHGKIPKTNEIFWREKISKTVARDASVNQALVSSGWHVLRFWQHEIKHDLIGCVQRVKQALITPNRNEKNGSKVLSE